MSYQIAEPLRPVFSEPFGDLGGGCTIWRADARTLPVPSESVQLIVTSPPYNAQIKYRGYIDWQTWPAYWDDLIVPSIHEMYRVLAPGGRLCLNFANVIRYRVPGGRKNQEAVWPKLIDAVLWPVLEAAGFLPRERFTWIKGDEGELVAPSTAWGSWCSPNNPVMRAIGEPVFVLSKGSYGIKGRPGETSDLTPDEFMTWTRNIWSIPQDSSRANPFPARFPVELAHRLIKLYSYPFDTVLDPFCGSGTTLRAAGRLDRNAIGVDTSGYYARVSAARYLNRWEDDRPERLSEPAGYYRRLR